MKETKKGTKAIRVINNNVYYGQYYNNDFQVLDSKCGVTERQIKNFTRKYFV